MKTFITCLLPGLFMLAPYAAQAGGRPPVLYQHQWTLPAPTHGAVRLDLDDQDVHMQVVPGDKVEVKVVIRGDADDKRDLVKRYKPVVETLGNDVVIHSKDNDGDWHWSFFGDESQALITVTLPKAVPVRFDLDSGDFTFKGGHDHASLAGNVDYSDVMIHASPRKLDLSTDSGDVRVTLESPAKRVEVKSDSGDVTFHGKARNITLNTDSGDARIVGRFDHATMKTDSGDIHAAGLTGTVRARTDSGDILAGWEQLEPGARIDMQAESGDISAVVPAHAKLRGVISTDGGSITSDFTGRYNKAHTHLELEGPVKAAQVQIDTESGDVELRKGD